MTRREEIIDTANKFYKGDEVSTFVVAAQWADRTMIDKAVKWLEENCTVEGQCIIKLDNFKKAMLEE